MLVRFRPGAPSFAASRLRLARPSSPYRSETAKLARRSRLAKPGDITGLRVGRPPSRWNSFFNCQTADTPPRSRNAKCARVVHEQCPQRKGRRESRARDAPAASRPKNRKDTSVVTTGLPKRSGLPCANGFNGFLRALSGDRAFLPPSPVTMLSHRPCLMPASRHQDHTTSPSAVGALVWQSHPRPPHPASTSVTIAIRPSCEAGRAKRNH